jgi:hypothetical protein
MWFTLKRQLEELLFIKEIEDGVRFPDGTMFVSS